MSETLLSGLARADSDAGPEVTPLGEGRMVREDGWREVHRLFHVERRSKSAIARQLALDRKTVRGILQAAAWQAYTRTERADTLLAEHASYLQTRPRSSTPRASCSRSCAGRAATAAATRR